MTGGGQTHTYNSLNQLTSTRTADGTQTNYRYDGDGNRISAQRPNGTTTTYQWDPVSGVLAAELDGTGSVLRRHHYGTERLGLSTSEADFTYHTDRLGVLRGISDADGAVVETAEWEPYGAPRDTAPAGQEGSVSPFRWVGGHDDTAGLLSLDARSYDPQTSTFTQPDPAAAVPFSATYSYGAANPMVYADLNGLWPSLRQVAETTQSIAGPVASVTGVAAVGLAVTGVGAPLAAVLGAVSVSAGVLTAASSAYLAYDTCTGAKGSCANAVARAAVDTATVVPGMQVLRYTKHLSQTGKVADAVLPGLPASAPKPLTRGFTGRITPRNVKEQLAMTEVRSAPAGRQLPLTLTDSRWKSSAGWAKMQQTVNGVTVHYVRNERKNAFDDFKFVRP